MSELSQLVERLRREAGFEVFHQASGRVDLNDFHDNRHGDSVNYVRAVHNLRNPEPNTSSLIMGLVDGAVGGREGWGDGYGKEFHLEKFNVVAYGILPKKQYLDITHIEPVRRQVKARGLRGLLGGTDFVTEVQTRPSQITIYRGTQPLNEIINTSSSDDAYFMRFTIRAVVLAGSAGSMADPPHLTIVTNRDLVEQTIAYLERNPQDFYKLIRELLPHEQFPNVNRGILDHAQPTNTIIFLNVDQYANLFGSHADKVIRLQKKGGGPKLDNSAYDTYGKRVEVKR